MNNEELDKLEIKISYLESANAELNDVVIEQGKSITMLEIKLEAMEKKLKELIEEVGTPNRPSTRPPHY